MNRRDLLAGLFWLGISIFVCFESIWTGLGTFRSPGPGLLPLLSGLLLGALAIIFLLTSSLKKKAKTNIIDLWKGLEWNKVIWVLFSLFLYRLVLPIIGYLIATFGLMLFLLCITERKRMWVQALSAFVIVLVSYVIFYVLLDIRFPRGILGF